MLGDSQDDSLGFLGGENKNVRRREEGMSGRKGERRRKLRREWDSIRGGYRRVKSGEGYRGLKVRTEKQ